MFGGPLECAISLCPRLGQALQDAGTDLSFGGADHILVGDSVRRCGNEMAQGTPSDHQILRPAAR